MHYPALDKICSDLTTYRLKWSGSTMLGYNNAQTQQSSGLTMLGINNARTQQFSNWTRHSEQRKVKLLHDFKHCTTLKTLGLGSSVCLMIMLRPGWMMTGGSILRRAKILSSSPKHPTRFWSPHSPLFSTLQELFLPWQKGLNVKLTTPFHLVPRLKQTGLYFHSHKPLHDVNGENFVILLFV